jgi:hypothetical protein
MVCVFMVWCGFGRECLTSSNYAQPLIKVNTFFKTIFNLFFGAQLIQNQRLAKTESPQAVKLEAIFPTLLSRAKVGKLDRLRGGKVNGPEAVERLRMPL